MLLGQDTGCHSSPMGSMFWYTGFGNRICFVLPSIYVCPSLSEEVLHRHAHHGERVDKEVKKKSLYLLATKEPKGLYYYY